MSDGEGEPDVETFEKVDSGASAVYPMQARPRPRCSPSYSAQVVSELKSIVPDPAGFIPLRLVKAEEVLEQLRAEKKGGWGLEVDDLI